MIPLTDLGGCHGLASRNQSRSVWLALEPSENFLRWDGELPELFFSSCFIVQAVPRPCLVLSYHIFLTFSVAFSWEGGPWFFCEVSPCPNPWSVPTFFYLTAHSIQLSGACFYLSPWLTRVIVPPGIQGVCSRAGFQQLRPWATKLNSGSLFFLLPKENGLYLLYEVIKQITQECLSGWRG